MDKSLLPVLQESLASLEVVQEILPLWTDWGTRDSGVWVHSLGCTFWTALGRRLGAIAISEAPAPDEGDFANVGNPVRSDSLWFSKDTRRPVALVEFERYSGPRDEDKLISKVNNLLLAHHRWGEAAEILVLAYWTKGLVPLPQHASLAQIVRQGFETPIRERVFGSASGQILFYQFVMQENGDSLLRLSSIIPRGLS
jgi:hypothetical protein